MTCKDCVYSETCRYRFWPIPLSDCIYDESNKVEKSGCPFEERQQKTYKDNICGGNKMKRLTIRNADGSVSQPVDSTFIKVLNKLAEYEDIGLEPYEVRRIKLRKQRRQNGKTYKDDFFEKFPSAPVEDGYPTVCRKSIYGIVCGCDSIGCKKCWDEVIPQTEKN